MSTLIPEASPDMPGAVVPVSNLRWYVVHAYSGMEKAVERNIRERIERAGMHDKFGRILVPTEEVIELKNGKKSVTERRFFPGQVVDLILILLDDAPTPANDGVIFLVQAHVDQIRPSANTLKDVLDMMRQGRDRLADCGQSFRLQLRLIEPSVLDRQACLMSDRSHEHQMIVGEFASRLGARIEVGGRADIGIEHPQGRMATPERNADRLANLAGSDRTP